MTVALGWLAMFVSVGIGLVVDRYARRSTWAQGLDALGRACDRARSEPGSCLRQEHGPEQHRAQCRRSAAAG